MALTNHLKNSDAQRRVLAAASGRHVVEGHAGWSYVVGSSPAHTIYFRQFLADTRGGWEGAEGIWFKGLLIPAADYHFLNGGQTETTEWFDSDVPHFRTVVCDIKAPTGIGEVDVAANPPGKNFRGIFKCDKFPDFDEDGNQIVPEDFNVPEKLEPGEIVVTVEDLRDGEMLNEEYFTYSVNPARVIAGWYIQYCADASPDDFKWTKWTEFRDFHAQTETVDYTSIAGFAGFGLTGAFYNGVAFNTFVRSHVTPVIDYPSSLAAPEDGLDISGFSARFEGYLKVPESGNYVFRLIHDDGGKLWVDNLITPIIDQWATFGTHDSANVALTEDDFVQVKLEWFDGAGSEPNLSQLSLQWKKPGDADFEVIPPEVLYPKSKTQPLYEAHVDFSVPTTIDEMINRVLFVSNSIRQDVDGKMEFYCIEQLTSVFHLQGDLPENERHILRDESGKDSFSISRSDRRVTELRNVWEAKFLDLDSRYLEEPLSPLMLEIHELIAAAGNRKVYGEPVDLGNMTRWQARKVLAYIISRAVLADIFIDAECTARTYKIIAQDIVEISHDLGDFEEKQFVALEATDNSPEETADTRIFRFQEWLTLAQIFARLSMVSEEIIPPGEEEL